MKVGDTNRYACNAQAVADAKAGVIVASEVTRTQWRERSTIIEPRFGQIKQHDGFRCWTVWGLEGVKTQWSLLCATLNLRVLYARWRANRPPETANSMAQTQPMAKKSKWMGRLCQCIAQVWENLLAPGAVLTCPRQIYPPKSFTPSSVKNLLRRSQRCRPTRQMCPM
jgi:hypothetical protein